jgi:hypothetical protein
MLVVGVIRIYFLLVFVHWLYSKDAKYVAKYTIFLGHLHDFLKAYIASSTLIERKQLGRNNERAFK